ncbi:MAG: thiamine diphosphokinase [Victivallaceae bacterium]|nr:thiamine diphosphokinase [Victivallaceae bacterium]
MPTNTAVILADGDFPRNRQVLAILEKADFIVSCDGATAALLRHGFTPDLVAGDLDSLSPGLKKRFSDRLFYDSGQEDNDLCKAFHCCLAAGRRDIVILGATGKREDHTLGNLSLLADFAPQVDSIKLVTDYGVFHAATTPRSFSSIPGQQISLFSFDSKQEITSTGLKYPLKKMRLTRWWRATLNEAQGSSFSLDFTSGSPVLVFCAHPGVGAKQ